MEIKLEVKSIDNKFIARSKKTCINKFRYTRQEKLNQFNDIVGFLISLNRIDESIEALESLLKISDLDGDDGIWMTDRSRSMLTYIYLLKNEHRKADEIIKPFVKHAKERMEADDSLINPINEDIEYFYSEYEYWKVQ